MKFGTFVGKLLAGAAMLAVASAVSAQNVVKLGMVGEFSGPFAQYGQQILGGMKAYMKLHGDTVAGKKIEIVQKDVGGPAPDVAKRLAQELVTRDNVDLLVGFGLTPNALAVAPVATEAKKAMVIMNAATSIITTKSPYIVRASMTTARGSIPRRHSPKRSKPPAARSSAASIRRCRIPISRRLSSASRTPSRKRCSCSCPRASRASPS